MPGRTFKVVPIIWVVFIIVNICWIFSLLFVILTNKIKWTLVDAIHHEQDVFMMSKFVSTKVICLGRLVAAFYFLFIFVFTLFSTTSNIWSYYTFWNFIICLLYFSCSSAMSVYQWQTKLILQPSNRYCSCGKWFRRIVWVFFQTQCCNSIVMFIFVWCLLFPLASKKKRSEFLGISNMTMHVVNLIALYVDFFLTRIPIHIHSYVFVFSIMMLYGYYEWYHYSQFHWWNYYFMDTSSAQNAFLYCILPISHIGVFMIVYYLSLCRDKMCHYNDISESMVSDLKRIEMEVQDEKKGSNKQTENESLENQIDVETVTKLDNISSPRNGTVAI